MNILQLVPTWEDVPPAAYGGIEQVVAELCRALARRGHNVFVSATAGSTIGEDHENITVLPCDTSSLRPREELSMEVKKKMAHEHVFDAWEQAKHLGIDVVHNHASEDGMEASFDGALPILTTVHNLPTRLGVWHEYTGHYATISNNARRVIPETAGRYAGTVHNAIDVSTFPFEKIGTRDYLFWIGRFAPVKGPHVAIEVAKRTGLHLVLAGKVDADVPEDVEYFEKEIKPHLDRENIFHVGEVGDKRKRVLYSKAIATLMPINWEEPFGMVTIESLACGTPVIAFARGALPEVIRDGETGFLVDTLDEMVDAVGYLPSIDPRDCRRDMFERFDADVMAAEYENAYMKAISAYSDTHTGPVVPSGSAKGGQAV